MTFPSHADILAQHRPYGLDCACGRPINSNADWARHVDQVWREACAIRAVDQLDALPSGAIIRDAEGRAWERDDEGNLSGLYGPWSCIGFEVPSWSDEVDLPAILIHLPGWSDQ